MITIRSGELFVEKYNEENKTNLTPKEIFCMLAEKAFNGRRHMVNWTNSKFFVYLKEYNNFIIRNKVIERLKDGVSAENISKELKIKLSEVVKINKDYVEGCKTNEEPSFEDALNGFCGLIENDERGIETSLNIYGGCAVPSHGDMQTTEFNYCDNLNFTIDERYCSFIGSFFQILVGNFATVINNKDIVWLMYKSFNAYYKFIHENEVIADKQLPTWNGCYFYQEVMRPFKHYANNDFIENNKLSGEKISTINFLEYLEAVSRLTNVNVSNMAFENFGQTNITCGQLTVDLDGVKGWFNIFDKIVTNDDEDFDIDKYCKLFDKKNLLRVCMEFGEVTANMIDPLFDLKTRMRNNEFSGKDKIKFLNEYLKIIMSEKEVNMAKDLGSFLTKSTKTKKSLSFKSELEAIFEAKKIVNLGKALVTFCDKASVPYNEGTPYEVVTHFANDKNKDKLMEFLMYTKFNM